MPFNMSLNNTGNYQGAYSIELTPEAGTDNVPTSASTKVKGQTVIVETGRIAQVMGGIQFYALERPFSWDYKFIRCIRDGDGNLLWVNNNCTEEITE